MNKSRNDQPTYWFTAKTSRCLEPTSPQPVPCCFQKSEQQQHLRNANVIGDAPTSGSKQDENIRKPLILPTNGCDDRTGTFFEVYESPVLEEDGVEEKHYNDDVFGELIRKDDDYGIPDPSSGRHRKTMSTTEDKIYRSDREFLKRQSHKKMMWFFRKVGLRHPAAIRTHLERVKHPEYEIPNLGCVYPHPGLSIAFDDRWEIDEDCEEFEHTPKRRKVSNTNNPAAGSRNTQTTTSMTYYQMYCASTALVERVKTIMGPQKIDDSDYNKRVLTFIADIIGRLLWHNNRTHTVMFAKSDHYDRGCFLLYSRQAEPTPYMMRSDSYFCRRHESEKFKYIAPQPDLTRANSTRLSNESAIYVVGCNWTDMWESFGYDYRITKCRPLKPLYENIKRIDTSILEHTFSGINIYVNSGHINPPLGARATSFDIISVLLREPDLGRTCFDDSPAYRGFVERFVTLGIMNMHCWLKFNYEMQQFGNRSYARSNVLDQIVLHSVHYRRETRELRTNRVFYYRNTKGFICSLSLADDMFESYTNTADDIGVQGEKNNRIVYFYDILQAFEYENVHDVNYLAFNEWEDVKCMIHESSFTLGQRLTASILNGPLPDDPFYPKSTMSPNDLAIDRMLERAIKHSKKLKLLTPDLIKGDRTEEAKKSKKKKKKNVKGPSSGEVHEFLGIPELLMVDGPGINGNVIKNALSIAGENRIQDGYVSPTRPAFETDHLVKHDGQEFRVKIAFGGINPTCTGNDSTSVDYGPSPCLRAYEKLACVYFIDPKDQRQIRLLSGSRITNKAHPEYVELKMSDRILRVFTVQATEESYVVKPYVYFVFRNMPTCEIDDNLAEDMFEVIKSYDLFESNTRSPTVHVEDNIAPQPTYNIFAEHASQTGAAFDVEEWMKTLDSAPG